MSQIFYQASSKFLTSLRLVWQYIVAPVKIAVGVIKYLVQFFQRVLSQIAGARSWARNLVSQASSYKYWQLWATILAVISLIFASLAFWASLEANRYARWTANKDFALICADEYLQHLSKECPDMKKITMPAPPGFDGTFTRRDASDLVVNEITKSQHEWAMQFINFISIHFVMVLFFLLPPFYFLIWGEVPSMIMLINVDPHKVFKTAKWDLPDPFYGLHLRRIQHSLNILRHTQIFELVGFLCYLHYKIGTGDIPTNERILKVMDGLGLMTAGQLLWALVLFLRIDDLEKHSTCSMSLPKPYDMTPGTHDRLISRSAQNLGSGAARKGYGGGITMKMTLMFHREEGKALYPAKKQPVCIKIDDREGLRVELIPYTEQRSSPPLQ